MGSQVTQRTRRHIRASALLLLVVVAIPPLGEAGSRAPRLRPPRGYRVAAGETLAQGLDHFVLKAVNPSQVVHVARLAKGAPLRLVPVLSNNRVAGPRPRTERTSAMCRRVRCLVAVNGDFFARSGVPVGGIVANGEPLRSPGRREQMIIEPDGTARLGTLDLSGSLVATYPLRNNLLGFDLPDEGGSEERPLVVGGVNVRRPADRIVLYTPRFGPKTETNRYGVEVRVQIVDPAGPIRLDRPTTVRFMDVQERRGGARIPSDGAVLSGHGQAGRALLDLWRDIQSKRALPDVTLRFDSEPNALQSFAGNPVLLRDGVASFRGDGGSIYRGRAPRTIVGFTSRGDVMLVTVDGRQNRWAAGMTLVEAARLARSLGLVYALNLDGGGSTTFVRFGKVVSRPSDRVVRRDGRTRTTQSPRRGDVVIRSAERPVAIALAVVREG